MRLFQLLLVLSLVSPLLASFAFSVLRVCAPVCQSAPIHCPPEEVVDDDKFQICLPYIRFLYQDTGLWKNFLNHSTHAGIRVRLLSSCFKNRYVSGCVGLENRCRHGVEHTQILGGLTQRLCVRFLNPALFQPGHRYIYNGNSFSSSEQFRAQEHAIYNNLAQLEPGDGKTAEDDYEEDEYWFLWETAKPGSGYEHLP